jgi:hypothetical protein
MKLTAEKAKSTATGYNRKRYRGAVITHYGKILNTIKARAKRGERSLTFKCKIWAFEEHHAVRFFCRKHRDFRVSWTYDGKPADGRVDLDKHEPFDITIKW